MLIVAVPAFEVEAELVLEVVEVVDVVEDETMEVVEVVVVVVVVDGHEPFVLKYAVRATLPPRRTVRAEFVLPSCQWQKTVLR
jgi:hypothetical protein